LGYNINKDNSGEKSLQAKNFMKLFNLILVSFSKIRQRKKELDKFLYWLSEHIGHDEYVLGIRNESLYKLFFNPPFRIGDKPKKGKWSPNEKKPSFILIAKKRKKNIPFSIDENWCRIGEGDFLDLYEAKNRFQNRSLPLRFGFSAAEKKQAVGIARKALEKFLKEGAILKPEDFGGLSRRFFMVSDLGVALWRMGQIRGSWVLEGAPLGEGIIEAAVKASRDSRFKPLSYQELQDTRIEITLVPDLKLPLSRHSIEQNKILPHKGYLLTYKDKKGWFLPEVFNVKRFRNLTEFLDNLAQEKAGLPPKIWNKAEIKLFDVEDFIESADKEEILDLHGPIVAPKSGADENNLRKRLELAADWLLNIQENDGNFPPIINPLTGRTTQIDWPRSAFCAWALAEFALLTGEKKYEKTAKKHFEFIGKYIWEAGFNFQPLVFTYLGQEALALFRLAQNRNYYLAAIKIAERILAIGEIAFENITFQQIASFLAELAKLERRFLEPALRFADTAKDDFENKLSRNISQNLADQAELVNTFNKIFDLAGDSRHKEFSHKIADWLINHQLSQGPNGIFGPFAEAANSDFVYSRGTGKIFEVLAGLPEFREKAQKALAWLLSMQYTEENVFFVPAEIRPKIIGGFRHDYFNQEAWVDSAGHFLLGGVRFIRNKSS